MKGFNNPMQIYKHFSTVRNVTQILKSGLLRIIFAKEEYFLLFLRIGSICKELLNGVQEEKLITTIA